MIDKRPRASRAVSATVEISGARKRALREAVERHRGEHLSRIDAGAATKHIALAAVAMGLGCYLFRCTNEAALRAVLDLPPSVRVDWLAAVGHPAETPSIAPKAPRQVVYVDVWGGEEWK